MQSAARSVEILIKKGSHLNHGLEFESPLRPF